MVIEICTNSYKSAQNAVEAGADRIELCSEIVLGGLSPSLALVKQVKRDFSIPVHVLVRPRSGNFCYSTIELEEMKMQIQSFKEWGCEGVVLGVLNPLNEIDIDRMKWLVDASQGMQITFHRAFDWLPNPLKGLEELEQLGVNTLLSSGQQKSALEGRSLLKQLKANSTKITVMPGGGINRNNIKIFKEEGFQSIHFSGILPQNKIQQAVPLSFWSPNFISDSEIPISDSNNLIEIIKSIQ